MFDCHLHLIRLWSNSRFCLSWNCNPQLCSRLLCLHVTWCCIQQIPHAYYSVAGLRYAVTVYSHCWARLLHTFCCCFSRCGVQFLDDCLNVFRRLHFRWNRYMTRCFARFAIFNDNQIFDCAVLGTYFWWVVLNYFLELREIEILVAKRNVDWTLSSQLDIVWSHIWKFHCSSTRGCLARSFFFFGDYYILLMVFSSVYTSCETLRFVAISSCSLFFVYCSDEKR